MHHASLLGHKDLVQHQELSEVFCTGFRLLLALHICILLYLLFLLDDERLEKLASLQTYLKESEGKVVGMDLAEFETFLDSTEGTDFKFLGNWLEVCYF